ncbi:MAG: AN1-type zinc finger domain-containing protein [Nitrososphaerales archaeon]
MQCEKCGTDEPFPFTCSYCGKKFCVDHRIPENHDCTEIWMARPPLKAPPPPSRKRFFRSSSFGADAYKQQGAFWFSRTELKHLAVGTLLVTLVALSLTGSFRPNSITLSLSLLFASSFLLHEMAHKFTAQKNRLWSEFRLVPFGALLTLISIIFPLKIIAPGAVIISGRSTLSTIGRTAFAGPLTNILLGFGLLLLSLFVPNQNISWILSWGANVNGILAIFNLIPFGVLDGQKIISWNIKVWAVAVAFSAALLVLRSVT